MSEFEQAITIECSDYNEVLLINKRGDRYQLILGRKSKKAEGTVMWQMCYPQFDKKPKDVAVPWNIPLGNRTQGIALALNIAKALGWKPETDSDIPF